MFTFSKPLDQITANSAGGHIIFGVAESNGMPTELAAISEYKIDDAKLRLENIIGRRG